MDENELRRHMHQVIFSTCINIARLDDNVHDLHKSLNWYPGRAELFWVTWKEGQETLTQKFTAMLPAIDFYMQQFPRQVNEENI